MTMAKKKQNRHRKHDDSNVSVIKNTDRQILTIAIHAALADDPRLQVRQYILATRG